MPIKAVSYSHGQPVEKTSNHHPVRAGHAHLSTVASIYKGPQPIATIAGKTFINHPHVAAIAFAIPEYVSLLSRLRSALGASLFCPLGV